MPEAIIKAKTKIGVLNPAEQSRYGDALYEALRGGVMLDPLTQTAPDITIDDAYQISTRFLMRRLNDGERVIGKKIGVTSQAVQKMLNVNQPDFGFLTDQMLFDDGVDIIIADQLIQPRAEGEIAFRLKDDLDQKNVTPQDVLTATDHIMPCFEIVDSRIRDWKIQIQDTIADNASCGVFVLGANRCDPRNVDLERCVLRMEKNGVEISRGVGAATLGSPLKAIAWLAQTLGGYGHRLCAGDIILSGALVPLAPVAAGDRLKVSLDDVGVVSVNFR